MRNWGGLLEEILHMICERVDTFKDLVAFGGVCFEWRRVAIEQNNRKTLLPLPCLMLSEPPNNKDDNRREFFSITEGNIHTYELPELRGKMCIEANGWIITSSDKGEMSLIHPMTHVEIPLPHHNTSKYYQESRMNPLHFVQQVAFSSSPCPKNDTDCVIMILHGPKGLVGYCKLGDKKWNVVENGQRCANSSLRYYRGKFYVLNCHGEMWEYDVIRKSNDNGPVSMRKLEVNLNSYIRTCMSYLVESAGSLHIVIRHGFELHYAISSKFWVLEIDVVTGKYKELTSLGTKVIFLGHSAAVAVDTSWYPELIPNSIYFTDDYPTRYSFMPEGGGTDMGIYNYGDQSVQPHYTGKSLSFVCPPVWTFLTSR